MPATTTSLVGDGRGETRIHWGDRSVCACATPHSKEPCIVAERVSGNITLLGVPCSVNADPPFIPVECVFLFATVEQRPRVLTQSRGDPLPYYFRRGISATSEGTSYSNPWNFLLPHIARGIQPPDQLTEWRGAQQAPLVRCLRDNRGAVINFRPRAIIRSGGKQQEGNHPKDLRRQGQ